ncbi:unnamed protein product [Linum trigynum]|uniref:Secreted protein n=1 Tax=Linum trigynum TaxID=586398 RepID=A0AAV2F7D7_9ROSI
MYLFFLCSLFYSSFFIWMGSLFFFLGPDPPAPCRSIRLHQDTQLLSLDLLLYLPVSLLLETNEKKEQNGKAASSIDASRGGNDGAGG